MKSEHLTFQKGFRVSVSNDRSQGAVMVIAKGEKKAGRTIGTGAPINGSSSCQAPARR